MSLLHIVQRLGRRCGLDIRRFHEGLNADCVHAKTLARCGIDLVLDVGANTGQFGHQLRSKYGYRGRLISFEPMAAARVELQARAAKDPTWEVMDFGLGEVSGVETLNVSANSQSSSLLPMDDRHIAAAPEACYIRSEIVTIKTLDEIFPALGTASREVFLKLDVQGYEMRVLTGARAALEKIRLVRLEMSICPLYQSEILIEDLIAYMRRLGFNLVAIEPNFVDPRSGALLQVDGLFCRL